MMAGGNRKRFTEKRVYAAVLKVLAALKELRAALDDCVPFLSEIPPFPELRTPKPVQEEHPHVTTLVVQTLSPEEILKVHASKAVPEPDTHQAVPEPEVKGSETPHMSAIKAVFTEAFADATKTTTDIVIKYGKLFQLVLKFLAALVPGFLLVGASIAIGGTMVAIIVKPEFLVALAFRFLEAVPQYLQFAAGRMLDSVVAEIGARTGLARSEPLVASISPPPPPHIELVDPQPRSPMFDNTVMAFLVMIGYALFAADAPAP